ncbi:MAG: helicase-associated domain-containing protein [Thermaerobacter sp.]|nr:helicase-associated domain-containing protein [Thermaerobacter sp.]
MYDPTRPLVVQSDHSLLLEADHPEFEAARDFLSRFAELLASPEHVHTYRITRLSLWNAAESGAKAQDILAGLTQFSKFPVPENVLYEIQDTMQRYGRLVLTRDGQGRLVLSADEAELLREVRGHDRVAALLGDPIDARTCSVPEGSRGALKQQLLRIGWPVRDLAGHAHGAPLPLALRDATVSGKPLALRPYQERAVDAYWAAGRAEGGSGVVVLPCGAGKTLVGIAAMAKAQASTLILCTSTLAVRQWIAEILDKTTLSPEDVGEYTGSRKQLRPVTVATYHIASHQKGHLSLFSAQDWGLIVYDEVHLLPAPVFRLTADIQARRRLGLTATLLREDNHEGDVFSLIGPKKFDAPWKELEGQGWIATAHCTEVRVAMSETTRERYAAAEEREQFRIAAENPAKLAAVQELVAQHLAQGDRILVIGRFLSQLHDLSQALSAPLLTGETPQGERERLFSDFRSGALSLLVVSNVANFSLDLPEASVAIEVSGTFGSRQEEAQRLGRLLRPKADGRAAHFYALVTGGSQEQQFAALRQRFLTEQGYRYRIAAFSQAHSDAVVDLGAERRRRAGAEGGSGNA